jgi:YHS domain-containing protein
VHGLHERERVVVAGNFLLDSESRMKMPAGAGHTPAMSAQETMAAEKRANKAKDPICGMDVDTSTKLKVEREGKTWYFCSEHCKRQFEASNPPSSPTGATAKDPICGMDVDTSTKLKVERDGKTWYFCSEHCKRQFEASEGGRR